MLMSERLYGGWLWILNMAMLGVGGVLMRFMGRMGWGSGRILEGVGGSCLTTLDLRWGMAPNFFFGMMFGVGLKLSRYLFSNLLSIARFKDAAVADHLELSSAFSHFLHLVMEVCFNHIWNINFLRAAHDWEMNHFSSLFTLLYSIRVRQDDDDRLRWVPSKLGLFDVKSYYKVLVPHDITHFPWRSI